MLQQRRPAIIFFACGLAFLALSAGCLFLPEPLNFYLFGAQYTLVPLTGGYLAALCAAFSACGFLGGVFCTVLYFRQKDEKLVRVTGLLIELRSELTRIAITRNYGGSTWHAVLLEQLRYKLLERYNGICATCDKIYDLKLTDITDRKHAHMYTTIVNQTQNIVDQLELMKSELFFATEQAALIDCMDTQKRTIINNNFIQNVDDLVLQAISAHPGRANKKALKSAYKKCVMQDSALSQ